MAEKLKVLKARYRELTGRETASENVKYIEKIIAEAENTETVSDDMPEADEDTTVVEVDSDQMARFRHIHGVNTAARKILFVEK